MIDPNCKAHRGAVGDGDCSGPVEWAAVYRSSANAAKVLFRTPGCYKHASAEVDRAIAAGTIARVDIERLDQEGAS